MTTISNTAEHSKVEIEASLDSAKYNAIPEHTRHSLKLFLFHRCPPGSTLLCLLEGRDPVRTILGFDEPHLAALRPLCMFLHWEVPSNVFGNPQKVAAWLAGETPMFENWTGGQYYICDPCNSHDEDDEVEA